MVHQNSDIYRQCITEVEVYRGVEDKACHVSKGRTQRNKIMFDRGGLLYVYLIYGMHWMLNVVTGKVEEPQAVLIRSVADIKGPGRLTKALGIDRSFHGEDLVVSRRIYIEDNPVDHKKIVRKPRIGVDYAGEYWKNIPWRYVLKE